MTSLSANNSNNFMKAMNKMKRFSAGVIVLWAVAGRCLAQSSGAPPPPPGASDQQVQAKDLEGKRGKLQVDDFTGSFGYSIPIQCAPARNGSEPALALTYSSKGESGWCGVGWKLDVGYIERNTQNGIPVPFSATTHLPIKQYDDSKGFILNLFGKQIKLLPTATNGSYLEFDAEVNTDFLRCICDTNNNKWQVYDKSGNVYYFGETASSRVSNPKTGWSGYSGTFHWALDQIVTATGDWTTIAYTNCTSPYTGQPERTLYPTQITYNGHTNYNGYSTSVAGAHTISFGMEARPDWRFSYRWGFRTEQSRRLTNIVCQVGGQNVWRYALSYGTSPATKRSLLESVTVYGSDDSTPLPVQTFTYQGNTNAVSFSPVVQWGGLTLVSPGIETFVTELDSIYGYVYGDLLDIDGDGLPDWVVYDYTTSPNQFLVQKNLGKPGSNSFGLQHGFGPSATSGYPIPSGDGTWAALNSQHVRLRDINGDGLPDKVCDWWAYVYNTPNTYTNFMVMTNTGTGFATSATAWPVSDGPAAAGNDLYLYQCVESGGVNTGFFDINGDGLPDRVMSGYYFQGPMTNFVVQFNTGSGFTTTNLFGPYTSQNWNTNVISYYWAGIETPYVHMVDINGDGLPDRVMLPIDTNNPVQPVMPQNLRTNFMVEYNDGYSFECTNTSPAIRGGADVWPGVNPQWTTNYDYAEVQNLPYVGLYDLNGDGLPDRVMLDDTTANNNSTNKSWLVYLNNGHGFDTNAIHVTNIFNQSIGSSSPNDPGWWGIESSYSGSTVVTLMDINGDGLLDRVMTVYGNSGSSYFLVQTNTGPFPDLLTTVSNGIGGVTAISYVPSTVWDNRSNPTNANSGSTLPFVQQTVAAVTESDGINPPRTNSYSYAGGFYDGGRREFSGFAVVTNTDATLRTTVTYFHTGGGRNYSALGEYQDAGSFAKRGMACRIETYGNDNELYHVQVNQVDQASLGNARYFPFVTLTFDCDYPGNGTPKVTATDFAYDTTTGNLTNKIEYGQVNNFNPTNVGSFSFQDADGTDTQYHNTHYATISGNSYILDHPATVNLTDTNNNVIQETDYSYNSPGGTIATKRVRISSGYYATNSYGSYNSYGLATLTTNPVGVVTKITYDSSYNIYPATNRIRANPSSETTNDLITTASYDARSGLASDVTDPMGVRMHNTFDVFCRLTESDKYPVGGTAVWMKKAGYILGVISSGSAASYIAVTNNDGVGGVESRTYFDGFGRPVQTRIQGESANSYRVVSTAYDARGEAFLTTWPSFGTSSSFSKPGSGITASWIGYDAPGRVATNRPATVTFDSNGAFSSKNDSSGDTGTSPLAARTWSFVNGTDTWWKICTDEDGKVRRYQLDAFGRNTVIQEVDGANTYTTTLKYDLANNLTNIVNNNAENIYYAYNDAGSMVAMANPHLGQWTYLRDYAGRLRVQTDARGDVVSNSYVNSSGQQDPLGRLQAQTVFGTNYTNHVLIPAFTNTYVYDSNGGDGAYAVYPGLLYKVTDSEGWEKNGYDNRGRLIKTVRYLNINGRTYTNSYTYNDGDKVTSIAYPNSGPTITNSYFTGGSIKQVANNASFSGNNYYTVAATGYDEFGHVTNFAYGNSLTTARSYYSTSKRLKTISCGSGGSIFNRTYQYTAGDDITSISGTGLTNVSVAYDNLHRIKTFTSLSGSYGYDSVGNITNNIEGGGSVYTYANPRKQAVRTAFGYTNLYDLCGNMIVRHGGLTNSQAMVYDADNRLKIFSQAGKIVVEFGYAADGARLWKRINQSATNLQVFIGNTYEEKGGKVLLHVFAGGQQVCTFEPTSTLNGGTISTNVGYYYHEDNLGSSSALSSSSGTQIEVNAFYPYGRPLSTNVQASFQVSRRFTGQIFDGELGLYFYANAGGPYGRPYDPELDDFMQADDRIPDLSNPQSYNRYSYCLRNPLRYTDPTGHYEDLGEIQILAGGYVAPGNGALIEFAGQQRLQTLNWAECAAINMHIAAERGNAVRAEVYAKQVQKSGVDYNTLIAGAEHPAQTSQNLLGVGVGLMGSVHTPEAGGAKVGTSEVAPETSAAPEVHGNSAASQKLQHGYEISKTADNDVVKAGISGQPLNQNGTSPRANRQVNQWNKQEGAGTYEAKVVTTQPNRQAALQWEKQNAERLRQEGNSMDKHDKP